jgi:hypothetical protein
VTSFGVESNTSPFGGTNALTQFILGGRTQIQAMMASQPTFVSVWIGNNDVLAASRTEPIQETRRSSRPCRHSRPITNRSSTASRE